MANNLVSMDQMIQVIKTNQEKWFESQKISLEYARNIGEALIHAKQLVKHGEWMSWLKTNFGQTDRSARHFMQIAKNWDEISKQKSFSDLTYSEALQLTSISKSEKYSSNNDFKEEARIILENHKQVLENQNKLLQEMYEYAKSCYHEYGHEQFENYKKALTNADFIKEHFGNEPETMYFLFDAIHAFHPNDTFESFRNRFDEDYCIDRTLQLHGIELPDADESNEKGNI